MYLEYYSIKRFFFFLSFGENFVIFLLFDAFCFVWWGDLVVWFKRMVAENGFEPLTFGL